MDDLRAMREARYEQRNAGTTTTTAAPRRVTARPPVAPALDGPAAQPAAQPATQPATTALCGHKAISGRTCTREAGHSAKSHRYS